jgi:lysosome membrane protein 2
MSLVALLFHPFLFSALCLTGASSLFLKDFEEVPAINLDPGQEFTIRNYIGYYMYNVTNPDDVENGDKPILKEVGPYVYRETRRKFDVQRVTDFTMKYKVSKYWEFMPELSEHRRETDLFNVINIPMLILANKLAAKNLPTAFNNILVDELIEKGDSLVRRNEQFGNVLYRGMNVSIYTEILDDVLQGNVPVEYANGLFALYKKDNNTVEGEYLVQSKGPNVGAVLSFNNRTKLEYWGGDYCNKIEGTDGYSFPPPVSEKTPLKIFYPELCRSVYLKFDGKTELNDVPVNRFSFPEDLLEDPTVDERNLCFCSKPVRPTNISHSTCLKKGLVDYASCKQESPLLVSFPHFLYADEEYLNGTIGLSPSKEKHSTEFLVEPQTGTVLKAVRKFQFNVKLRPLDNVDLFKNVTNMIFPVFWTYRKLEVNSSSIHELRNELKKLAAATTKKASLDQNGSKRKEDGEMNVEGAENNVWPSSQGVGQGFAPKAEGEGRSSPSRRRTAGDTNGASLPMSTFTINVLIFLLTCHSHIAALH